MQKSSRAKIKLSIVILNYNAEKYLNNCLRSIPLKKDWEIIVADNGSTDNSLEYAKSEFPQITIIDNKKNIGFAAGNNRAIEKSSGEFVLLLNPDTVIVDDSIEKSLEYIESNPQVGAVTCRVELPDGTLDYSSHRGFPDPVSSLLHFLGLRHISKYSATKIPDEIHQIDALTGAFALIRKSAGNQVGWLDEEYFWNGEDIDFCYKLHEAKWKIMFIPNCKIIHYKGYASKASFTRKKAWAKNSTDVMLLFYKKRLAQKYNYLINISVYAGIKFLYVIRLLKSLA